MLLVAKARLNTLTAGLSVQLPLATVVIRGLLTSTTLTLLIIPALYPHWVRDETMRPRPLAGQTEMNESGL